MILAGELVLGRNQLLQTLGSEDSQAVHSVAQKINLVTSELQETVMLTRMQPVGLVFNKFPRVVRDLARSLGKEVALTMEGQEVELDKTIIEGLHDPLTHLVRNAVDHGIESPKNRRQAGKKSTGQLFLKAYHQAGLVILEIKDDGKGLDPQQLGEAAVAKGWLTADQNRSMSDAERLNLVFRPGFSTAAKVTEVSGRGVGLDVVKSNLDKVGGQVEINSRVGEGTTFIIKLPLDPGDHSVPHRLRRRGALCHSPGECPGIAAYSGRPGKGAPGNRGGCRGGAPPGTAPAPVAPGRGHGAHQPLLWTHRITLSNPNAAATWPTAAAAVLHWSRMSRKAPPRLEPRLTRRVPKMRSTGRRPTAATTPPAPCASRWSTPARSGYGLLVDKFHGAEEIVIKPLGTHHKNCRACAGATIMGDGRVALVLDVANLAGMAGLTSLAGSSRGKNWTARPPPRNSLTSMPSCFSARRRRKSLPYPFSWCSAWRKSRLLP